MRQRLSALEEEVTQLKQKVLFFIYRCSHQRGFFGVLDAASCLACMPRFTCAQNPLALFRCRDSRTACVVQESGSTEGYGVWTSPPVEIVFGASRDSKKTTTCGNTATRKQFHNNPGTLRSNCGIERKDDDSVGVREVLALSTARLCRSIDGSRTCAKVASSPSSKSSQAEQIHF